MQISFENVQLEVKETHDAKQWYLTVEEVAAGYEVNKSTIMMHLLNHANELREGIEIDRVNNIDSIGRNRQKPVIYREGVIKLGFFIRSKKAAAFRQWATNLIVEHLDKTGQNMQSLLSNLESRLTFRLDTIDNVCRGFRDEIDELKETLNIFFTDDETVQIRKAIKELKDTRGLDGRAVIGHIKKTLDINSVYGSNNGYKILNVIKNMLGGGIHLVKGEKNETSI